MFVAVPRCARVSRHFDIKVTTISAARLDGCGSDRGDLSPSSWPSDLNLGKEPGTSTIHPPIREWAHPPISESIHSISSDFRATDLVLALADNIAAF